MIDGQQWRIQDSPDRERPPRGFGKILLLPPATKLQQGNVFTPVCHSVHRGWQTPLLGRPPMQTPPCTVHAGRYGQQAGGMHATGMHTCLAKFLLKTA